MPAQSFSSQRVSVVHMDEEGINDLLNSHGFFKRQAEPEPEPDSEPDPDLVEEQSEEDRQEL